MEHGQPIYDPDGLYFRGTVDGTKAARERLKAAVEDKLGFYKHYPPDSCDECQHDIAFNEGLKFVLDLLSEPTNSKKE